MVSAFFGLTSNYRKVIFQQIHDLVYHGGGGFQHSEVYNMPVWLRIFHIKKLSEYNQKQNDRLEDQKRQIRGGSNNNISRPNINPSSTYNF